MATEKDYAVLSAYVYNDARGEGNDVILPSTWDELPISASDTTSGFAALFTGGFSAGAFRNKATGELVVAYKGTDSFEDCLVRIARQLLTPNLIRRQASC